MIGIICVRFSIILSVEIFFCLELDIAARKDIGLRLRFRTQGVKAIQNSEVSRHKMLYVDLHIEMNVVTILFAEVIVL